MTSKPIFARPVVLLQAEALCSLVASCIAYHLLYPHHWVLFGYLFLIPDFSLVLFLRGPSGVASTVYNMAHSYVLPALLGGIALYATSFLFGALALIWVCHVSMDRMLGYGLKYPTSFRFTHIQSAADPSAVPATGSSSASVRLRRQ